MALRKCHRWIRSNRGEFHQNVSAGVRVIAATSGDGAHQNSGKMRGIFQEGDWVTSTDSCRDPFWMFVLKIDFYALMRVWETSSCFSLFLSFLPATIESRRRFVYSFGRFSTWRYDHNLQSIHKKGKAGGAAFVLYHMSVFIHGTEIWLSCNSSSLAKI